VLLISLAAFSLCLAWACIPSMDGLVVKMCTGEKREPLLYPPNQNSGLSCILLLSISHPPSFLFLWRLLTLLIFSGQVEVVGCEAKTGVQTLETSHYLPLHHWRAVFLLDLNWTTNHVVLSMQSKQLERQRAFHALCPLRTLSCAHLFLVKFPKKKKVNIQSQPGGDQQLGVTTLASMSGRISQKLTLCISRMVRRMGTGFSLGRRHS
jgi:hypothetical protein